MAEAVSCPTKSHTFVFHCQQHRSWAAAHRDALMRFQPVAPPSGEGWNGSGILGAGRTRAATLASAATDVAASTVETIGSAVKGFFGRFGGWGSSSKQ